MKSMFSSKPIQATEKCNWHQKGQRAAGVTAVAYASELKTHRTKHSIKSVSALISTKNFKWIQISRELWSLVVTTLQTDAALTGWKEDCEWWTAGQPIILEMLKRYTVKNTADFHRPHEARNLKCFVVILTLWSCSHWGRCNYVHSVMNRLRWRCQ